MSKNKPAKVAYYWKYRDEAMSQVKSAGILGILDYDTDSNGSIAGTQNKFKISGVRYRTDCPEIDVFAAGISATNQSEMPGFFNGKDYLTIREIGGIDSVQTSFEVLGDSYAAALAEGDHLEGPSGEIMRIEAVASGSPNYTLTVERGAHATTEAATAYDGKLEILKPRTGMARIELTGDLDPLDPPTLDTAIGLGEGILLEWSNTYEGDDIAKLSHWKIYYSETPGFAATLDPEDEETYGGFVEVAGNQAIKIFNPTTDGLAEVDTTFYFAITAVSESGIESDPSNEKGAKAVGTIGPNPNGPEDPVCSIEVSGAYRIKVEGKKPTGTDSALGVMNVKKATFEIYYATSGSGNPTTGTPDGSQTLIDTYTDESVPYSIEIGVNTYGFKDYWARVKFTDGENAESAWTASAVLELTGQSNTTDPDAATGVFLNVITDELNPFSRYALLVVGIGATGNYDSAYQCELAFRVDGEGTFDSGADTPFSGATDPRSTPWTWGGYPAVRSNIKLEIDRRWEVTGRIRNAYGWTAWLTPEEITFTGAATSADTDVCTLAGFAAWTRADDPPGGWTTQLKQPGPGQVVFDFRLPTNNSSTVWNIAVMGTTSATIPTETVLKSQADGTAVSIPGTYEVKIYGITATANQYQNKYIRIGAWGTKNETDTLQVRHIASNTASSGGFFTITVSGNERLANIDPAGSVAAWAITDAPVWKLFDYYEDFPVGNQKFGQVTPRKQIFEADATGYKFIAIAHNRFGYGPPRAADGTELGSTSTGDAVYRTIDAVKESDVQDKAITTAKADDALNPIGHSIEFTPTDYRSFSWAAGSVYFANGSSVNLGSGSSGNLSTNTEYWVSFLPSSPGGGLTITTSPDTALSGGRVLIAIATTTSDTNEFCAILPRWGKGSKMTAANFVAGRLSALTVHAGELTAGTLTGLTIQTSSNAATSGGIVMNGTDFKVYASDGDLEVTVDESGLTIYNDGGTNPVATLNSAGLALKPSAGGFGGILSSNDTATALLNFWYSLTKIATIGATDSDTFTIDLGTKDLKITGGNIDLTPAGKMSLADDLEIGTAETGQFINLFAWVDGSSDPGIRYDKTNSKWQISQNGTTWTDLT